MRLVVLLIPIALVGGYVVHGLSSHDHGWAGPHPPAVAVPPGPSAAPAAPVAPVAPAKPVSVARLATVDARFDTTMVDGQFRVRGAASANVIAAVEGALQLVSVRLSEGDRLDAERVTELVAWSASLVADAAADVEGYLEIETPEGERIVINANGRRTIRLEPK